MGNKGLSFSKCSVNIGQGTRVFNGRKGEKGRGVFSEELTLELAFFREPVFWTTDMHLSLRASQKELCKVCELGTVYMP